MLPVFISCLFENLFWENLLFNINIVILLIVVDTAFPLMSHELQQSSDMGQPTVNNEWCELELQSFHNRGEGPYEGHLLVESTY